MCNEWYTIVRYLSYSGSMEVAVDICIRLHPSSSTRREKYHYSDHDESRDMNKGMKSIGMQSLLFVEEPSIYSM